MKKKMHWTQTKKGKAILAARAKAQHGKSKAEKIIEKNLGEPKVLAKTRESIYSRAAAMAVDSGEVPKMMNYVAHQLLVAAMRGAR